jgi:DNA-directed RNA polymerase subunit K
MTEKTEEIKYTKYEKARMVGARALQISMGAPSLLKLEAKDYAAMKYNPIKIATLEYDKDVLPISVRRPYPDTRKKDKEE